MSSVYLFVCVNDSIDLALDPLTVLRWSLMWRFLGKVLGTNRMGNLSFTYQNPFVPIGSAELLILNPLESFVNETRRGPKCSHVTKTRPAFSFIWRWNLFVFVRFLLRFQHFNIFPICKKLLAFRLGAVPHVQLFVIQYWASNELGYGRSAT